MRIKRKVKIKLPFKIRPRLCMVVRVEEKTIKRKKRRDRKRRRMKTKLKKKVIKRVNEYYFVL